MPYRVKVTWFFEGPQKGWTESLYIQPTSGTWAEAVAAVNAVNPVRAALLGQNLAIKAWRLQVVQDAGGNKVTRRGDTFQNLVINGDSQRPASDKDDCVEMDFLDSTQNRHKILFLGGIWREIVNNYGNYTPTPDWLSAMNNWIVKVVAGGFGWVARTPSIGFSITNYVQSADGFVDMTMSGNPFPGGASTTPQTVRVSGLQTEAGLSVLNGDLLVTPTGVNTCTTVKKIAVFPFVNVGVMKTFTYAFVQTNSVAPEKIVNHKRGAPLLESRGRRRVRARG
jgi:hypothetical protein